MFKNWKRIVSTRSQGYLNEKRTNPTQIFAIQYAGLALEHRGVYLLMNSLTILCLEALKGA